MLFIAESAIDALSAFSLADLQNPGTIFLSTCGAASRLPAWLEAWTPQRVIRAFDADDAGDEAADRLAARDRRVGRLRPEGEKDWNEILAARHAQ
ncbi:MAG: toprim domain-containing protein [Rhodospirillaceae bacterium]|nr:toprim domain-containing protein [Rhodospirillaceae bacterium]